MCKIHIFQSKYNLHLNTDLMRIKQNVRTKDEFEKQNYQRIMQS